MTNCGSFPTILVAEDGISSQNELVRCLQHQGYLVLTARDSAQALEIVKIHSRPIQLMLTGESMRGHTLATTIKQYRPNITILFLTQCADGAAQDPLAPELAKVQEILKPPGSSRSAA